MNPQRDGLIEGDIGVLSSEGVKEVQKRVYGRRICPKGTRGTYFIVGVRMREKKKTREDKKKHLV